MDPRAYIGAIWAQWGANDSLTLRWSFWGHAAPAPTFLIFVDGALFATTQASSVTLPPAAPGRVIRIGVLAVGPLAASLVDYSALAAAPARGGRLKLSVPAVDLVANPDYEGAVIYWSADGSDPTEQLIELYGANNTSFITGLLVDGVTYKFRARLKDIHGNLSAYGATVSGQVNAAPAAPTGTAAVYNHETRTAAIAATKPNPATGGIVGYEVVSNYLPGVGLQEALTEARLAWLPAAAAGLTWTTPELSEGLWRFAWRAVDGSGLRSSCTEATLRLARSGGELVQGSVAPAAPLDLDATAGAGTIKATIRLDSPADNQTIKVYVDGVLSGSVTVSAANVEYEYETEPLTHGQTYAVTARVAVTGSPESAAAGPVAVTVDGEAPSGSTTMALELTD